MVYAFYKFIHYLLGAYCKMYTNHSTLKYLVNKPVLGGRIYRWLLLFQEYDFEVIVKLGKMYVGPDHFSRLGTCEEDGCLDDALLDTQLFSVGMVDDYFANIVYFFSIGVALMDYTTAQKKWLVLRATDYQLIVGQLYKLGTNEILIRCIIEHERSMILIESHEGVKGGHFVGKSIAHKILDVGLWWHTLHKDDKEYCQSCDIFQRVGKPNRRDEIPLIP